MKIKHVYGNVLRLDIPLTIKIRTMEGDVPTEREEPFYPDTSKPVLVELTSKYNITKYTYEATMNGNVAHIEDDGIIGIGTYKVTVKCFDEEGNPYRYMVRDIIEICDATIDAGIEAGVEFNAETYTLEGAVFVSYGGGSYEQVQADWTEYDTNSKAYIKNKPNLTQYATKKEVEGEVKTEKERAEKAEKALSDDVAKKPSTEDSEHKFEIVDDTEESNPILQLDSRLSTDEDGNIETKNFKSSETATKKEVDELEKLIKQGGRGTGGDSSTYTEDTTDGSQFSIGDDTIKKNDIFKIFAGYPYTKNFNGKQIVETLNKLSAITINCIGESVTQGQEGLTSPDADTTSINRYSNYLQELLPNATIRNLGAGGEWTNDICARMGWISTIIKKSFVLKGNGTETLLFDYSNNSTSPDMVDGLNGLPMSGSAQEWDGRTKKTIGYLYGYIDVKLRFVSESDDTGLDYRNKIYISRRKIVDYDINVGEGTLLNYGGSQFNGINILLTGGNGGYGNDVDLYMNLIESALNKNEKTIVLQHYSARDWTQKDIFRKMREPLMKKLGDRYVDLWSYICSRECFDDLGIAPTTDTDISSERKDKGIYSDEYGIANGYLPSSFWRYSYTPNNQKVDFIHLNALGYKAIAIICYKKLLQLNWI